ncbi:Gldg family protein [Croceicoccus mobilis]|uniref:ABC transporter n=1 Tax=Croceicoccus mobilis TaxID=1703339 RepID=A0A917DP63_9SPHN|nr:hypothetical protein [Croceicoccus mobilis]GGD55869.1 hypothetical protein GCM10010990_01300 [Croceicoccus mobilis]
MARLFRGFTLPLCGALALAACSAQPGAATGETVEAPAEQELRPLAIMTSLPILWGEGDIGDMLASDAAPNPVRAALETRFTLSPIDRLTELDDQPFLLLAQPRALAGDENVALDDWVRAGGQVLILADPMLTAESAYGLGDKRAPLMMTMLSPILARWGLSLTFDPASSPKQAMVAGVPPIPVQRPGSLSLTGEGHDSSCEIKREGLIAECRIGAGRALIVADAAMVENGDDAGEVAISALSALMAEAFTDETGD